MYDMKTKSKRVAYVPPKKYTLAEQEQMIKDDLLIDADTSEAQAVNGPYYPEKGITKESLLSYAAECRQKAAGKIDVNAFIKGKA